MHKPPAPTERPIAPRIPEPLDCCNNECGDACVWTLYDQLREKYAADLEAWQIAQLLKD